MATRACLYYERLLSLSELSSLSADLRRPAFIGLVRLVSIFWVGGGVMGLV